MIEPVIPARASDDIPPLLAVQSRYDLPLSIPGVEAVPEESPPAVLALMSEMIRTARQAAARGVEDAVQAGQQLVQGTVAALDQVFMNLQAGANRIRLAVAEAPVPAPPAVDIGPDTAGAVDVPAAPAPASAPSSARGAAIRTTVLALAAVLLYRTWSDSRMSAGMILRRRLRRSMAAAQKTRNKASAESRE